MKELRYYLPSEKSENMGMKLLCFFKLREKTSI